MQKHEEDSVLQALCDGRPVYFRDEDGELYKLVSTAEREREEKRLKKLRPSLLKRFLIWSKFIMSKFIKG